MAREIDDIAKRKQYREEQFDGKRSTTDEYRGGRIFAGNSPNASYKHPIEKLTDNDHITPLEVIAERYPDLSKEQQKQIANQYYNLALTNSKLNRSKGALENHEYLQRQFKKGEAENLQTTARMLEKEVVSRTCARAEATKMTLENSVEKSSVGKAVSKMVDELEQSDLASIHHNSMQAAESAMVLTTITTIVDNAFQTARGEKSKEEAIKDSAKTVLETGATRYTQKTISQVTEKVINKTINQGFSQTTNIAGNNVAEATVKIGQQFMRYCKDEISDEELLENTGDILTEQLMIFAAECVLQGIPGGALVGRYVATVLYQSMKTVKMNEKQFGQYIDFMKELSYETTKEIEKYRAEFRLYAEEYNSYTMGQINRAFDLLDAGMFGNDVEKSSQAIEMLANTIGETVSDITEEMLFDTCWKGE